MPCPAYLNVSFSDREDIVKPVNLLGWNSTEIFREAVNVQDFDPYWVKVVHKQEILLSAYIGVSESSDNGHYVLITPGHQSDSLYAFCSVVDCTGDNAYTDIKLRKQFCTVYLDVNQDIEKMKDYSFLVEGHTCGFDLFSFEPVDGSFRFEPVAKSGDRVVDFRIPRQKDDSLIVSVWLRNSDSGTFDSLGVFSLGEYIRRLGYNWKSEELQDIYVKIDFLLGLFTINIDGWEEGLTISFIEQ